MRQPVALIENPVPRRIPFRHHGKSTEQINIIQNSKPTVIEEKVDKKVETKVETKDETKVSQKESVEVKDVLPEATTFRKKKTSMKKSSDKKVFNEQ